MPKRLLILDFNRGELVEKLPSIEELNTNSILIILDEQLDKIWLWLGRDTSFLARRMVMRTTQTLKRFGFEKDGDRIEGLSEIVIVDEKDFTRADQQTHYETLKERIIQVSAAHEAAVELKPVPVAEEEKLPKSEIPIPPIVTEELPEPPPLPPPEVDELEVSPSETMAGDQEESQLTPLPPVDSDIPEASAETSEPITVETPEIPQERIAIPNGDISIQTPHSPLTASERDIPSVDIKMGLLIAAILKEFPEIFISVHGSNVVVESAEGTLTVFRILDRELELSPDFDFKGKQETVISHYRGIISYFVPP